MAATPNGSPDATAGYGHLMRGRYQAIVVEKERYLLELARYIVLSPVRAQLAQTVARWAWSSYRATAGLRQRPPWHCTAWLLRQFGAPTKHAHTVYRHFVADRLPVGAPWKDLRGQIYLGSDRFLRRLGARSDASVNSLDQVPRAMLVPDRPTAREIIATVARRFALPPEEVFNRHQCQQLFRLVVFLLRRVGNLLRRDLAAMVGVSPSRVSHIQLKSDLSHSH